MTQENNKKGNINDLMQNLYNDLPFQIRRACRTMGTTPEAMGIDLSKIAKGYKNCWDINPEQRHLWLKIHAEVKCVKCLKMVYGELIVKKANLQIIDSSGFVIFADPVCETCLDEKENKKPKLKIRQDRDGVGQLLCHNCHLVVEKTLPYKDGWTYCLPCFLKISGV